MHIQAYLFFNGRCDEAVEFYRTTLGAEVTRSLRYKDSPEPCEAGRLPPGWDDKIMHTSFRIGDTTVMASDGCSPEPSGFQGFSLVLNVPNEAEAVRLFGALSDGGQVQMPLAKTFFAPCFGTVTDRFGVSWMVLVEA